MSHAPTRDRVFQAIDELGFVPHSEAASRTRRGVGRIGVVAPITAYASFEVRLRGVIDALRDTSYELVLYDQQSLAQRADYLASLPPVDWVRRSVTSLVVTVDGTCGGEPQRGQPVALMVTRRRCPGRRRRGRRLGHRPLVHVHHAADRTVRRSVLSTRLAMPDR